MNKNLNMDEIMVNLRNSMRLELEFIESHAAFDNKEHTLESIFGEFSYQPLLAERAKAEEDWLTFKNFIASDFLSLEYPPCYIYVERDRVIAIWFIPNELLIDGLEVEEEEFILCNLERQLESLKLCELVYLDPSRAERNIKVELYLEEYYRKKQFLKMLLPKEMIKSNDSK